MLFLKKYKKTCQCPTIKLVNKKGFFSSYFFFIYKNMAMLKKKPDRHRKRLIL